MEFGVAWDEFKRNGETVSKSKFFKIEAAREKFITKLVEKDNFFRILAYSSSK
ncbi:MAG: hypothetical protein DDT29_02151 [Dehalococcoidia bacterium]|nr:hypothetical protein [Bacillota bacterium]